MSKPPKLRLAAADNLDALRALCRYETHGGYVWAGVMDDGALVCVPCLRANYREVFRDTREGAKSGWALVGYTNSGESEETETCVHCNDPMWEHEAEPERLCIVDGSYGIYVPVRFAAKFRNNSAYCVLNVTPADWDELEKGPDEEGYWDLWQEICDDAVIIDNETGVRYTLEQDGDLFMVAKS